MNREIPLHMTGTFEVRNRLSELNRVCTAGWGQPKFRRLQYAPDHPYLVGPGNAPAICRFADLLLSLGDDAWIANPDLFEASSDEIVLAIVDRYGLPLRTVYSLKTGLMRSDPYYSESLLKDFYQSHYRHIYASRDGSDLARTRTQFFGSQVAKGVEFYEVLRREGIEFESVLDVGCGMGGMLVPFQQAGKRCIGCDWGEDYLKDGRRVGLKLIEGDLEAVREEGPFDLVIVSHVLEHVRDVRAFLRSIFGLLSDKGSILAEVPGIFGVPSAYKGNLLWYLQNAHLWHFTRNTLERLLQDAGFWPVWSDEKVVCIASKSKAADRRPANRDAKDGLAFLDNLERKYCSIFRIDDRLRRRLRLLKMAIMPPRNWLTAS